MPKRYTAEVNRLRAALRGHHGPALMAAVRREIERFAVAAVVADNSQRYVASNAAARALTGYTQSELAALTVMDLTPIPHDDTGRQLWREFISRGIQRGDYDLVPKSGRVQRVRYWAFASIAPGLHLSLMVPDGGGGAANT